MSTSFTDIQGALNTRLSTLASSPPVAWENNDYNEHSGELYLRPTSLFGETNQACLGDDGKDMSDGLYQVDVLIPTDEGSSTWPDAIADHFKRGTTLTQNSTNLRIRSVSIGPGAKDKNFYIVPVTINYQVFTAARS